MAAVATRQAPKKKKSSSTPGNLVRIFEEGRFTDLTIRIQVVEHQAANKRRRTSRNTHDSEGAMEVVQVHAVIMCSRSAYFDRALGGNFKESRDMCIEVEVADAEGQD